MLSDSIDWAAENAPLHEEPSVTNMIFIDTINGPNQTGGLSLTPGRVMFISTWALDATLHVLPHELGHNLGLGHGDYGASDDPKNLMSAAIPSNDIADIYPDGQGYLHLTNEQIDRAWSSPLVVDAP